MPYHECTKNENQDSQCNWILKEEKERKEKKEEMSKKEEKEGIEREEEEEKPCITINRGTICCFASNKEDIKIRRDLLPSSPFGRDAKSLHSSGRRKNKASLRARRNAIPGALPLRPGGAIGEKGAPVWARGGGCAEPGRGVKGVFRITE